MRGECKKHISHNNCLKIILFFTFFQAPNSLNSVTILTVNLAVVVEQPKANDDENPDGQVGMEELEKTDRLDLLIQSYPQINIKRRSSIDLDIHNSKVFSSDRFKS